MLTIQHKKQNTAENEYDKVLLIPLTHTAVL